MAAAALGQALPMKNRQAGWGAMPAVSSVPAGADSGSNDPSSSPWRTSRALLNTTINDPALTERMAPTLGRVVGAENVEVLDPVMGGEDFAYFANEIPGFFFRLGMVAPGVESGGHHTPTFQADDASVPIGMRAMSNLLLDYLRNRPTTE